MQRYIICHLWKSVHFTFFYPQCKIVLWVNIKTLELELKVVDCWEKKLRSQAFKTALTLYVVSWDRGTQVMELYLRLQWQVMTICVKMRWILHLKVKTKIGGM
jgi:hypothetical protein